MFGFLVGILRSLVTGMIYAVREFRWLATIQVVTEVGVYLPIVGLVQFGYFGDLSLPKLLWMELAVELSRLFLQAMLATHSLRRSTTSYSKVADEITMSPSSDKPDEPSVYSP